MGAELSVSEVEDIDAVLWYIELCLEWYPFRSQQIIKRLSQIEVSKSVSIIFWVRVGKLVVSRFKRHWRFIYFTPQKEILTFVKSKYDDLHSQGILSSKNHSLLILDLNEKSGVKIG